MFSPLVRVGARLQRCCRKAKARSYAISTAREPILQPGLLSDPTAKTWNVLDTKVSQSTLTGGVSVLSVDTPVPITTLSVYVQAGTRYETRKTVGAAHFLRHLAFRNTQLKSGLRLYRDLDHVGANLSVQFTREHVAYHVTVPRTPTTATDETPLQLAVESLRAVLAPTLHEWEIDSVRGIVTSETEHLSTLQTVLEQVHAEAFRDSTLGQPLYCPSYAIPYMDGFVISAHIEHNYFPGKQITVVASGIEHERLIPVLSKSFTNPQAPSFYLELFNKPPLQYEKPSQTTTYTGGQNVRIPGRGGTTLAIAYPSISVSHQDAVVVEVLKEALGQGASHLSLGSGLNSVLNRVVEKNKFIENVGAFNFAYSDAGLFGVHAQAEEGHAKQLMAAMVDVLTNLPLTKEDISRAQNQVKLNLLRPLVTDSRKLADVILANGAKPLTEYLAKVDAVTLSDVQRVAKSLRAAQPTIVSAGDVRGVPLRL